MLQQIDLAAQSPLSDLEMEAGSGIEPLYEDLQSSA